jgi:GMP reductase
MNKSLNYKDIVLKHKQSIVSSRTECDTSTIIASKKIEVPVFCSNMPSVLTYDVVKQFDAEGWFHVWHRIGNATYKYVDRANKDNLNFVSVSVGVKESDQLLLNNLKSKKYRIDAITVDVALIYNKTFEPYLMWLRKTFPATYLIAGNCDSFEAILWLQNLGFDCAKINIGVSKACRTRQNTGFGSSTVSDLMEITSKFCISPEGKKISIIADGGLTISDGEVWIGDIAKAIRFGADFVMSGSLFAHCLDSPALVHGYSGNSTARIKGHDNHVEGTTVFLESNGLTIKQMMKLIKDSLKSSISYAGGKTLSSLRGVRAEIII